MERIKLNYFDVTRCGYYRYGEENPEFCNLGETLEQLQRFIDAKTLRQTKLFTPAPDQNLLPVYIANLERDPGTGDTLLITWNESPTNADGKVTAAAGDDRVGEVDVSVMDAPEGSIPGYPCYFYFIPQRSIVVAIRFDGQTFGGQPGVSAYLHEFLAKASRHVVATEDEEGATIYGYVEEHGGTIKQVRPFYRTVQSKIAGEVDYLREHIGQIKKLVRKDLIVTASPAGHTRLLSIWNILGIVDPTPPESGVIKYKYEIDCTIDTNELNQLVEVGSQEHDKYSDIGFRLTGDARVRWLSHCLVRNELEVDITRSDAGFPEARAFFDELLMRREAILSVLPND